MLKTMHVSDRASGFIYDSWLKTTKKLIAVGWKRSLLRDKLVLIRNFSFALSCVISTLYVKPQIVLAKIVSKLKYIKHSCEIPTIGIKSAWREYSS